MNILRDASNLQTHLRLYESLVETRLNILRIRPNVRQNWVALAGAYHLNGNLEEAKKTLENYEEILKEVPNYDVELSEVLLYHIRILEELGEYAPALSKLDTEAKARRIVDRTAIMEQRGMARVNLVSSPTFKTF
jgi:N-alpha-acetyltransferase 15/16, NatA auxiliary subunit